MVIRLVHFENGMVEYTPNAFITKVVEIAKENGDASLAEKIVDVRSAKAYVFEFCDNYDTSTVNHVSSFFYYMWNKWDMRECAVIFPDLSNHLWNKWCGYNGNVATFYSNLDRDCQNRLTERAIQMYEGSKSIG